jgi:phosphopentomutase
MACFLTLVLDGVGIGAQPDADRYGDAGAHTLGHVCATQRPHLPHLARLGLGAIAPLAGVPATDAPAAHYGRMQAVSAGKDSTTGHWELAGLRLARPFPTYPDGFPDAVIDAFVEATGVPGVVGNRAASGTAIVDALGAEHQATGQPIVYTSADSVFQVAAHTGTIPTARLYDLCRTARQAVCTGPHAVGRVIARPFEGTPGAYARVDADRKDFALPPSQAPGVQGASLPAALQAAGVRTVSVGKVASLFAYEGFDATVDTGGNDDGLAATLDQLRAYADAPEDERGDLFIWTNLIDFDQRYGHRNDPGGFARALEAFDAAVPDLLRALPADGRLVVTADHGNDPTTDSTDHSREYVPLLAYDHRIGDAGRSLGTRPSFNDHAATVAAFFGLDLDTPGHAFG